MFNRRFIREKAVQAYYGFVQGGPESAVACQKNMLTGLDQTAELYYQHLIFMVELSDYTRQRYEEAVKRGQRSQDELDVLRLMAQNTAIEHIRRDPNFIRKRNLYKFSWKDRQHDLFAAIYEILFLSSEGKGSAAATIRENLAETFPVEKEMEYISLEEKHEMDQDLDTEILPHVPADVFLRDKEYIKRLYKRKISTSSVMRSYCEDRSIFWEGDYESVIFWVYSTLNKLDLSQECCIDKGWNQDDEDVVFGRNLLEKTLLNQEEYKGYISVRLVNWKPERVGLMENVLLRTAVSELINFPSIPVKVTLNEYIELSKKFCSPETASFINGVLNNIVVDLKAAHKLKKSGRGLL